MNPQAILAAIVLALALAGGGYWKGWSDRAARAELATSNATIESHQQAAAEQRPAIAAAGQLETENAKERVVYRTITQTVDRVVDRPVYRAVCLDDDGLRLARAAIAGTPADPAQPDGTVPGPAGAR